METLRLYGDTKRHNLNNRKLAFRSSLRIKTFYPHVVCVYCTWIFNRVKWSSMLTCSDWRVTTTSFHFSQFPFSNDRMMEYKKHPKKFNYNFSHYLTIILLQTDKVTSSKIGNDITFELIIWTMRYCLTYFVNVLCCYLKLLVFCIALNLVTFDFL